MFTGIVETTGEVISVEDKGTNKTFHITCPLSHEFQVDQSVSHSGACLTVEAVQNGKHQVTAIFETLEKTNLGTWRPGTLVNIERCLQINGRLDGHLVQGHVDTTAACISVEDKSGSWGYRFSFDPRFGMLIIEKGSICLNGISLTIFDISHNEFSVAIIPYTYEHTNIRQVEAGGQVNLEFDMVGKYINRRSDLRDVT